MLLLMIIFMILVFFSIFLSFNFFIEDYVRRDMEGQLSSAVRDIRQNSGSILFSSQVVQISGGAPPQIVIDPMRVYTSVVWYLRTQNANSEVTTAIYYSADYIRVYPNSEYDMLQNLDEMDNIINIIKQNGLTEENLVYKTAAPFGTYYLTTVDLGPIYDLTGLSAVFYVSSGKYDIFISNIYSMLLIILFVAMLFTILYVLFISRSISKPIQKLCGFAGEIGHGNFKRSEYSFRDRELLDLNDRMNETAAKLEKNDEDQKIFFQNVSHELKTPLMSVRGYAEGIKYGVFADEKERNDAANIIIAESERLDALVSDLLYISKMDASEAFGETAYPAKIDLAGLAENCAEKLRGLLINQNNSKKIEVIRPPETLYIYGDEESLMRALMNVIANCVQYAETLVEISFHENNTGVFLFVKDDGAGIDENDLPNIFKRFYKGKSGKHGIGLSIAKSIIEHNGAVITADNRLDGSGAEFVIEFAK